MLSHLKIGPKLLLAPAAVVLLLVFASCASYLAMLGQNRSFELIVQERAARIRQASALVAEARQAHANVYQLLTWRSASFADARVDALGREMRQRHASIASRFGALGGTVRPDAAAARMLGLGRAAFDGYRRDVRDVLELAQLDHSISASAMSKAERSFDVMERHLATLAAHEQALSERAQGDARADFDAAVILMPALVALAVLLTAAITVTVRAAILRELAAIGEAASELGQGRLKVARRSYGRDEIAATARALDASIRNLNGTLRAMRASAQRVVAGVERSAGERPAGALKRAHEIAPHQRQRVRDAAHTADALQRQAALLSQAVAQLVLDEAAPPLLVLAGGLDVPAAASRAHLQLAARAGLTRSR